MSFGLSWIKTVVSSSTIHASNLLFHPLIPLEETGTALCDSYNCGQCATQQAQALPACIGGGSNAKLRSDCAADEVRSHENRVQTASEPFRNRGRITDLITSEQLFHDIGLPPLDIETDRIMLCGSPGMLEDLRQTFEQRGFAEGSHAELGHFVIEKAFVER
jgi:hypothetical protein